VVQPITTVQLLQPIFRNLSPETQYTLHDIA